MTHIEVPDIVYSLSRHYGLTFLANFSVRMTETSPNTVSLYRLRSEFQSYHYNMVANIVKTSRNTPEKNSRVSQILERESRIVK